ncbi:MAG TPA: hypothetical protein VG709_01310 [Actinomycetota bacterium]|nr:hypothetical protein [Actinomycetota bacterium]
MRRLVVLLLLPACVTASGEATSISAAGAPTCTIFPRNSFWHADVRSLPVHPRSADWIRSMGGPNARLHPDFGPSEGGRPYGIPYEVVGASDEKVGIEFLYEEESDPGPYPFGPDTPIEQGGDRHALMLHRNECFLYELFDADWNDGDPTAGSGAIFDLRSNRLRPAGWTSADAAGLSGFAGLVRRDEVEAGVIDHAIRVTATPTRSRYVWPARHEASDVTDRRVPPMGAWFRLRRGFDLSGFRRETRVVLRAMKVHGLVVADNGSNWFFGGASEEGWSEPVLDELKSVRVRAFQAVDTRPMLVSRDSGRVRPRYVGG